MLIFIVRTEPHRTVHLLVLLQSHLSRHHPYSHQLEARLHAIDLLKEKKEEERREERKGKLGK